VLESGFSNRSPLYRPVALLLFSLMTPLTSLAENTSPTPVLRVAVASNFRPAASELARLYENHSGAEITISSASSGMLAAQILEGAPFDLFLSADEARARAVIGTGEGRDAPVCYARGSLVLLGSDDLDTALSNPDLSIAIANPRNAPYGAAALAVLEREGFAGPEKRRVVQGTNVQQALQFFERGATDLALVARALSPDSGAAIPMHWHSPIDQYAVVVARDGRQEAARAFLSFLSSEVARALLSDLGYESC
jgi:molybdate transport system substrate-binding protein